MISLFSAFNFEQQRSRFRQPKRLSKEERRAVDVAKSILTVRRMKPHKPRRMLPLLSLITLGKVNNVNFSMKKN
jgi:hypothetical protein